MSVRLTLTPRAESHIDDAALWYETQSPGLGAEFLRVLGATFQRISTFPLSGFQVDESDLPSESRRVSLQRFPYSVFYVVGQEEIVVIGCLHQRSDPQTWRKLN